MVERLSSGEVAAAAAGCRRCRCRRSLHRSPNCRHTSCCLVSKHWHGLVHSPVLLRCLDIKLAEDSSQPLHRLRSLAAWLQQHASPGQLQALRLQGQLPIYHAGEAAEADALTEGMLAHCTGLTSLHLADRWHFTVGSWLATMPHLRLLSIKTWGSIEVSVPRQQMTSLFEMNLHTSDQIRFKPGSGLPATVAKLSLRGLMEEGLPAEVRFQGACPHAQWSKGHAPCSIQGFQLPRTSRSSRLPCR